MERQYKNYDNIGKMKITFSLFILLNLYESINS